MFYWSFSAGIGRTGALITIDVAIGLMERDLPVCITTYFATKISNKSTWHFQLMTAAGVMLYIQKVATIF